MALRVSETSKPHQNRHSERGKYSAALCWLAACSPMSFDVNTLGDTVQGLPTYQQSQLNRMPRYSLSAQRYTMREGNQFTTARG